MDRTKGIVIAVLVLVLMGFVYYQFYMPQAKGGIFPYKVACNVDLKNDWFSSVKLGDVVCEKKICLMPFSIIDAIIPRIPVYTDLGTVSVTSGNVGGSDWFRLSEGDQKQIYIETDCGAPTEVARIVGKSTPTLITPLPLPVVPIFEKTVMLQ